MDEARFQDDGAEFAAILASATLFSQRLPWFHGVFPANLIMIDRAGVIRFSIGSVTNGHVFPTNSSIFELFGSAETPYGNARNILERALTGERLSFTLHSPRTDHDYRVHLGPLRATRGIIGAVAFIQDVTRRLSIERELRETAERFRQLAENASDVICVTDEALRILYVTPNSTALFELGPELLMGHSPLGLVASEDRARVAIGIENMLASDAPAREIFRAHRPDAAPRWVETSARPFRDERSERRIVWVSRDISDRIAAQAALRESEERFRQFAENIDAVVGLVTFRMGKFLYLSPSVEAMTGLRIEALYEDPAALIPVIHPDDIGVLFRTTSEPVTRPYDRELRIVRRNGELRWVWLRAWLFGEESDPNARVAFVASDVTERHERERRLEAEVERRTAELARANEKLRELQSRLLAAERLRAAEDVAASVAHSINNPLAALLGNLELLRGDKPDDPSLERLQKLAMRIRSVVDRTLALFRRGALDLREFPLRDLLEDLHHELSERARLTGATVTVLAAERLPSIVGDRALLHAALASVAENALDAVAGGGKIELRARVVPEVGVVQLRIRDDGRGIPAELRERVFEPFFTTKGGGTGLGLAIAKAIVVGHGGRIAIGDAPSGTAIEIDLPLEARTGL